MRKTFTLLAATVCISLQAQNIKWNVNLDAQKVFIENKSQFDNRNYLSGSEILFGTEDGPSQILFTKTGLTYRLEKRERIKVDEAEERERGRSHEEMEAKEHEINITTDAVNMKWLNANSNVEVLAMDAVSHYYNFKAGDHSIDNVKAFQKLIYKNLYSNIDVEYVFHPKEGIEYNFILHPGADPSQIKMEYSDVSKISFDKQHNLHFKTEFGDIIDHAPNTFYSNGKIPIASKFILNGKTVSFELENFDATKEVTIDPWTVTPNMPNANKVFNIEADSLGNAYIYGGDMPFKLQKYNTSGILQWTFTNGWDSSNCWAGTLVVDKSGNSYITAGSAAEIAKVNTGGGQVWTNGGGLFNLDEYWSMSFNCDETQLIVGGTRLTGLIPVGDGKAFIIDMNNGNQLSNVSVAGAIPSFIFNDVNEIRSICFSPNGNYYFLTLDTIGSLTQTLGINWRHTSGYRFGYGSPNYGFTPQGQSIIRASMTNIYTANGDSVFMRDINTGNVIYGRPIPGGGHATTFLVPGTLPRNGGLVLDSCGNVYCGSQGNVTKYDANLNFISSSTTPSAVYDIALGTNGEIVASGNGFAVSLNMSACSQLPGVCNTMPIADLQASDSSFCENTCIDFTDLSVNNPTTWEWTFTGAQTTTSTLQNPTGICYTTAGNYNVTLIACSAVGCDTLIVSNMIHVDAIPTVSLGSDTTICIGDSVTLDAGAGFSSYLWSNNAITQTITVSSTGTFSVIVNPTGCSASDTVVVITQACSSVIAALASSDTSFCEKQCIDFFDLSQNNPISWQWTFQGANPDTSTQQNPTGICYNAYGAFTVTLIACNANGCDTLTYTNFINEYQNPVDSIWLNGNTLFSLQFASYQWYEVTSGPIAGATNQFYFPAQPGSYYCLATDSLGCDATSNIVVITALDEINNGSNIHIQPNPGNGIFTLSGKDMSKYPYTIKIFSVDGKLVYQNESKKIANNQLDLSTLAVGIYDVQININDVIQNLKLIVNKQ